MKCDCKPNVGNKLTGLRCTVHIHLDYGIDVGERIVHCMVMQNNRYATSKKNGHQGDLKRKDFSRWQKDTFTHIDLWILIYVCRIN